MVYNITSVAELSAWDGSDTAVLLNDITITSSFTPVLIQPTGTFNGGGHSITFNYTGPSPAPGIFITWSTSYITDLIFIAAAPITSFLATGITTDPQPDGGVSLNQVELVYEFPVLTNCGGLIGGASGAPYLLSSALTLTNCKFSGELINNKSAAFVPDTNGPTLLMTSGASINFTGCVTNVKLSVTEGVNIPIYASCSDDSINVPFTLNNCISHVTMDPSNNAFLFLFCYTNGEITMTNCYSFCSGTGTILTAAVRCPVRSGSTVAVAMNNCYLYGTTSDVLMSMPIQGNQTVTLNYCTTTGSALTNLSSGAYTNNNSVTGLTGTPPNGYEPFASYNSNGYGTEWSHVGEDGYNKPLPLTVFTASPWSEYSIYSDVPVLYYSGPLPCLVKDTEILTTEGYIPVQHLMKGDILPDLEGNQTKVVSIYRRIVHKDDPEYYPYLVPQDYFGEGKPFKTLKLSQNHAYYHNGAWHHPKCSIPELKVPESKGVEYYHIQTTNYFDDVIIANGLEVETYAKGADKNSVWNCSKEKCSFLAR